MTLWFDVIISIWQSWPVLLFRLGAYPDTIGLPMISPAKKTQISFSNLISLFSFQGKQISELGFLGCINNSVELIRYQELTIFSKISNQAKSLVTVDKKSS